MRIPLPLTAPGALGANVAFERDTWLAVFLQALADEAADTLQLLLDLEHGWFAARVRAAGRRRTTQGRVGESADLRLVRRRVKQGAAH